jgi:hypothetical protein
VHVLGNVRHVFVGGEHFVQNGDLHDWYTW